MMYSHLSGLATEYLEPLLRVPVLGVGLSGKGPAVAIVCDPTVKEKTATIKLGYKIKEVMINSK